MGACQAFHADHFATEAATVHVTPSYRLYQLQFFTAENYELTVKAKALVLREYAVTKGQATFIRYMDVLSRLVFKQAEGGDDSVSQVGSCKGAWTLKWHSMAKAPGQDDAVSIAPSQKSHTSVFSNLSSRKSKASFADKLSRLSKQNA